MKKTIFFIFIFFSCGFSQEKKICQLGEDPADPTRRVDWTRECIVKPAAEQLVRMSTGSGKPVDCLLPRLTPVVVEKTTGVARWILGCGNQILQPNWVPQGTRECAPEPAQVQEIKLSPSTFTVEGEITHRTHRVEVGEIRHVHVHSGEVILKQDAPVSENPPFLQNKKSWWRRNRKWVIPLAILSGVAAGYAASRSGSAPKSQTQSLYQPLPPPIKR